MDTLWIEIIATGPSGSAGEASVELIGAGSGGVVEDGGSAAPAPAEAGMSSLKAYLPDDGGLRERLGLLSKSLELIGWSISASPYRDVGWTEKWKEGLKPVRVSTPHSPVSLTVLTSWQMRAPGENEKIIEVDPGMAFGTGSHPTTKMCLKALLQITAEGGEIPTLLDIGTGSGILAIAAKKLGCGRAVGTDIDEDALSAAVGNARQNSARVAFTTKPPLEVKGRFSVVAANILSGTLIELSKEIFSKVKPGGILILSGILREEASGVEKVYRALGMRPVRRLRGKGGGGDWSALVMKRCG